MTNPLTQEPSSGPERYDTPVTPVATQPQVAPVTAAADEAKRRLTSPWASLFALVLAFLWTLPTIGLLVTSFRSQRDINRDGWWNALANPGAFTLENYRQALEPGSSAS